MSKWQLTLIQCGEKLRKFGGTKSDVQYEMTHMIYLMQHNNCKGIPVVFIKDVPCQFVISKYNNTNTKKKIIMENYHFD